MKGPVLAALMLVLTACSADPTGAQSAPQSARPDQPAVKPVEPPPPPAAGEGGGCAADVNQCADGSFVSRDPARGCAFRACPGESR